jgi:tetratricopeptide (TPR) repeat protein
MKLGVFIILFVAVAAYDVDDEEDESFKYLELDAHKVKAWQARGKASLEAQKYRQAVESFRPALDMLNKFYDYGDTHDIAELFNYLGLAYEGLGEFGEALNHKKEALEMLQRLYENKDHLNLAVSLNNVGLVYYYTKAYAKSLEYYQEAFEMYRRINRDGSDRADVATLVNNVGMSYDGLGDHEKAMEHKKRALEMRKRLYNHADHAEVAASYSNIGTTYYLMRNYNKVCFA